MLFLPQAFGAGVFVFALLETFIKPAADVGAAGGLKFAFDFPIVTGHKGTDFFFALNNQRQGRRLYAANRGEVKATGLGIKGCHGTRAINADQPV